jgi:integrase/recombinase XerD
MSIEHRPISPLRQRMIEDMRLRKLAEKTQSGYIRWVRDFTRFLGRAPDTATAEDLRRYQLHLSEHGTSRISLNAAVTALRFFFEITLGRGELMAASGGVDGMDDVVKPPRMDLRRPPRAVTRPGAVEENRKLI